MHNRMLQTIYDEPAVVIIKGIPGHPEGAIRNPRKEQREAWIKQGICKIKVAPPPRGKLSLNKAKRK